LHGSDVAELPRDRIVVGASAARLHGLDIARDYEEIAVPPSSGVRSRRGLIVRHLVFPPGDVVTMRNFRVTSIHRTLRDLCVSESPVEALVAIDMAIRLARTTKAALGAYLETVCGLPGAGRLRRLVDLAEPADSPMETRLRWVLISNRLPRAQVQIDLHDVTGRFVGRADLLYPEARLVIEYDGGNHRDRLVADDQRQNLIINAGFRILRFTGPDVYNRAEVVAAQVRGALATPR
jgi:very-short-patch-repair endonuclease